MGIETVSYDPCPLRDIDHVKYTCKGFGLSSCCGNDHTRVSRPLSERETYDACERRCSRFEIDLQMGIYGLADLPCHHVRGPIRGPDCTRFYCSNGLNNGEQ